MEKQRWKESEKRREEERRSERRKSQKKEDAGARKGRKVACVFPMICGSGGSKSRLAKAAGVGPSGQMRDGKVRRFGAKHISKSKCTKHTNVGPLLEVEMSKKCMSLWREAHVEVKMYKTHHVRTTFGSWDAEKVHAVVARSTFRSPNVQNTPFSDRSWKLRCWKSARCFGAKRISKSKEWKTDGFGALLDVQISFCMAGPRDPAPCQKVSKTWGFCGIFKNDGRRGTFE